MTDTRPILVSGGPRSGTTWTGNVIGAAPEVFLIYEPFNDHVGARLHLPERFQRMTDAVGGPGTPVRRELDALMSLARFPDRTRLAARGVAERWLPGGWRHTPARLAARRLLRHRLDFVAPNRVCLKDPLAFYSADWIADTYGARVVMLLRHPCSVVASYLRLGWDSELGAMLRHGSPAGDPELGRAVAERRMTGRPDRLGDLILQWRLFTAWTMDMARRRPDWIFVVHDELCLDPMRGFRGLFATLGLTLSASVAAKIAGESSAEGGAAGPAVQHRHQRDSRAVVEAWRRTLSAEDASRILAETDAEWQAARTAPGRGRPTHVTC